MEKKIVVMFHYVKEGLVRSPNIIFDRIENALDKQKYQVIHLNQQHLPSEIGTFALIKELYKEIKEKKPDIIHISGIQEGFSCMVAAFLARCKRRILITHGFASEAEPRKVKKYVFQWITEPITLFLANIVQCNSWFSYNHSQVRRFAKNRRKMIYNIPTEEHQVNAVKNIRKQCEICENNVIFVSVGRIEKSKGYELLAEVIPKCRKGATFIIIGEGSYLEEMKLSLKQEITNKKVIFLGKVPNTEVCAILKECDVFVLPSYFETYGLVYIEAALAKLPSIGTDICAIPEIIRNNETGKLIEPGNKIQLKEAIDFFIKNPVETKVMGDAAYVWVKEMFDKQKIIQQIDELYQELLR